MKLRPGIIWFLAAACASEATSRDKADLPPHTHQESEAPQGPNTYALSFARNGATTATVVLTTTVRTEHGPKRPD